MAVWKNSSGSHWPHRGNKSVFRHDRFQLFNIGRAAHIHAIVSAPGHGPVTTHIFDAENPYLDSDTVFGVKDSLVRQFRPAGPGGPPDVSYIAEMNFVLAAAPETG